MFSWILAVIMLLSPVHNSFPPAVLANPGTGGGGGGSHSFSVVNQTSCGSTSNFNTTVNCTIPATTAGNTLLIIGGGNMDAGVTFTPAATTITSGSSISSTDGAWIVPNVTAGTTTFTIQFADNFNISTFLVLEVSGTVTASPVDVFASQTVTNTGATNTGSVTTTNANDVIIGWVNYTNSGQISMAGTGYTDVADSAQFSTSGHWVGVNYKIVSATGANNPPTTQSTSGSIEAGTVALKLQ